jgi:DNA replication and repair protein RecF
MFVSRLWLSDWRNHEALELSFARGLTAVIGPNGRGKTNLVEAIAYLATLESFRGAPTDALVRAGADAAFVRAEVTHDDGRDLLIETEIPRVGRSRVQVNRQKLHRSRDLLGVLRVSVFSPDDLVLVKGGPSERRRFLDDTLVALHPKHDALRSDLERVLRQRSTLLKQAGGRLTTEVALTLDVWDAKMASLGEAMAEARTTLVSELGPRVADAYERLAGRPSAVVLEYEASWRREGLANALAAGRADDVRRQQCLVGPHRDDLALALNTLVARTHASQGESRTLALALRLAAHEAVGDRVGSSPVLVLDDVFSELDEARSAALLANLPAGQVVLTTAAGIPDGINPDRLIAFDPVTR